MSAWISVKERLPEIDGKIVLGYITSKNRVILCYHIEHGGWSSWEGTVTHWQPLPEPPEDK